jgi:hypothetical protein
MDQYYYNKLFLNAILPNYKKKQETQFEGFKVIK